MQFSGYALRTAAGRLDEVRPAADDASRRVWPEFLLHASVAGVHQPQLWTRFPEYQYALVDERDGDIVAVGHSIPLAWRGMPSSLPAKGWDWAIADGMQTGDGARDILCALAILVLPEHQRKGIGRVMVEAMRVIGRRHGHDRLVVPLRPTLKSQYPLTPMERYVRWQDEDGLPFDPWLRLHVRAGGTVVGACTESYAVAGTVRQWEEWTGMRFPESGRYVVPGALSPVDVDTNTDRAEYVEANVWVSHEICGEVADALRHEG